MKGWDDLPPIPPAHRASFDREFIKILFPPKGAIIYSERLARRIGRNLVRHKKTPNKDLLGALANVPELDRLVAKQITNLRGVQK